MATVGSTEEQHAELGRNILHRSADRGDLRLHRNRSRGRRYREVAVCHFPGALFGIAGRAFGPKRQQSLGAGRDWVVSGRKIGTSRGCRLAIVVVLNSAPPNGAEPGGLPHATISHRGRPLLPFLNFR